MEPIIDPIPVQLIEQELTPDRLLRHTNKADNDIYVVTAHNAPNAMREIGRLREISFRAAGGGTGKACDIDEFDLMDPPCQQLVVWNPDKHEIIGAYRFICGWDVKVENSVPHIATGHLFKFSDKFLNEILPVTIELGRSFVRPEYQSTREGVRALFALDNLWDGLGALSVIMPNCKYFFGKMTMYPSYNRRCRDMILYFLNKHFPDKENLIVPMTPLQMDHDPKEFESMFCCDDFHDDYIILNRVIRSCGLTIPPLVNAYMSLSPTMKMFGTAINDGFGDVEETGILIAIDEIIESKRIRHIDNFAKEHPELVNQSIKELSRITSGVNKVKKP